MEGRQELYGEFGGRRFLKKGKNKETFENEVKCNR